MNLDGRGEFPRRRTGASRSATGGRGELFVLAVDADFDDAVVVLSPVDFRKHVPPRDPAQRA